MSMGIRPMWLRLTEEINSIDYLERAVEFLYRTDRDRTAWKWVVIGLHGALYGFAICACQGTNVDNVVTNKKRLIDFNEALRRCQDSNWMGSIGGGTALVLTSSHVKSIKLLKDTLRNNFQHYTPKGWSIELHGLPKMAIDIFEVIRFLAIKSNGYIHMTGTQRKRVTSLIFQAIKYAKNCRLYREANIIVP